MTNFKDSQKLRKEIESIEQFLQLGPLFDSPRIDKFKEPKKLRELRNTLRNLITYYDP